jgi:hypothetical protein
MNILFYMDRTKTLLSSGFVMNMDPRWIPNLTLNFFKFGFEFVEIFEFNSCSSRYDIPRNTTKNCELGDSLSTDSFGLGAVVFMQTILITYLFKRSAKLSESFDMVLWVLNKRARYRTPVN